MFNYLVAILTFVMVYAILSLGLNVQWGFTGLVNLGHVGFFAVGAYTSALLSKGGFPFISSIATAILVAAFFGTLVALTTLRLKEDFLAIVTLGFSEILRLFLINESWLTGGANGITLSRGPSKAFPIKGSSLSLHAGGVVILLPLLASPAPLMGECFVPSGDEVVAIRQEECLSIES
jgi:ABC-type branched-subunit amino acid transport system permease subunit